MDNKLFKLQENVTYYEWKYNTCHKFWKKEYFDEIKKAKAKLKEYKAKHYPEMLKPNLLTQPKPFLRMNDWTENYENYERIS